MLKKNLFEISVMKFRLYENKTSIPAFQLDNTTLVLYCIYIYKYIRNPIYIYNFSFVLYIYTNIYKIYIYTYITLVLYCIYIQIYT